MDGFIGSAISRRLRGSGWDIVGFSNGPAAGKNPCLYKGSVTDIDGLRAVFKRERPSACIHLAGLAHATVIPEEVEIVRRVNVEGTLNTARAAIEAGVRQFVFFSSAKVYGEKTSMAGCDEDDEPNPVGTYAKLKFEAEQALLTVAKKGAIGVVVVRPVAVFGRGDVKGNYARLIRAVRRGVFPLIGGGKACRSVAYLDRVTERIDRILGSSFISGRTYVFSDGAFELREILKSVRRATGHAFFPPVPGWVAEAAGISADWILKKATGNEGHAKEAVARWTDDFVVRAHRYDTDFGEIGPFDLDMAMAETCLPESPLKQ